MIDFPKDNLIVFSAVNPFSPFHCIPFLGVPSILVVGFATDSMDQVGVFIVARIGTILGFGVMQNVNKPIGTIEFFGPTWNDQVQRVDLIEGQHLEIGVPENFNGDRPAFLHLVNTAIDFALEVGAVFEIVIEPVADTGSERWTLVVESDESGKIFVRIKLLNVVRLEFLNEGVGQLKLEVRRTRIRFWRFPSAMPKIV
jgi:hypothetical protein